MTDTETMKDYLVGSYIYSCYQNNTGGINISGDVDMFYFVLGWHVHQLYPQMYGQIYNDLINICEGKFGETV